MVLSHRALDTPKIKPNDYSLRQLLSDAMNIQNISVLGNNYKP
ncbi:MAG TPA: hypothetical protein VFW07_00150 [Parafilimonas sp.]|nr:hypothetical protein [Parafilimonas sp.]